MHGLGSILKIIDAITAGAERTIVNIPRKDKFHRGSADTLYNKIIIEFENDLRSSLKHAKEQLAGYLLGQFHSGEGYNFTLIASDFINWKVYSPDISQLSSLRMFTEENLQLNEVVSASITLTESNVDDFYFWIDRFLFREEKQRATLKRIEESFGYQSNVFIESYREMIKHFVDLKKYGEVQVAFEQWNKFLSIAYGSFEASDSNFIIHTYLSVFSKMLAYSIVSNDDYINDTEMSGIIDGSIFHKYNISNFVDNDFFYWIKSEKSFKALKNVFRLIAQEISLFSFIDVDEDILKGVYQELIDLDTRHALGEYYTPDWLCERIVNEFIFEENSYILDPACGSGSFLRSAIHRFKELYPDLPVEHINEHIYGIDIHPLSVQISKTTLLLALGKDIGKAKKQVHLNIILANTLLAPEGFENLFGRDFKIKIDKQEFLLNTHLLEEMELFDEGLEICEELASQTIGKKNETENSFSKIINYKLSRYSLNGIIIDGFYKIYLGLKKVKENGRDSIWKFILQNIYKPYFLQKKFDYIIGNPPWFTYSSIKNKEYQDVLNELAEKYSVKSVRKANFPHLEIAAIFLAHCANYFLKDKGRLAFVLPRSFFSADHHDNTRSGTSIGFRLSEIWDLNDMTPLFRVPSCVLFADKAFARRAITAAGLGGKVFKGNLPGHNVKLKNVKDIITEKEVTWYYIKQGQSSAFSLRKGRTKQRTNSYKKLFKQGATIVPRTFYFVELNQELPPDFIERTINIKTPEDILAEAKKPWKMEFSGQIESEFLFCTAISRNILPYILYKPELIVLPIAIENNHDLRKRIIKLYTFKELRSNGRLKAARWFEDKENIWNILKTEKNEKVSSEAYLNWQNKLTDQVVDSRYIVLYSASAKDANAVTLIREELAGELEYNKLSFIVESKTYAFYTDNLDEAYFITAFLNSSIPNEMMKDFQTKGLFGARDVHKKILDIYFPKFDSKNELHIKLSKLSSEIHGKAKIYFQENSPKNILTSNYLGRMRRSIKHYLKDELKDIDNQVKKIIADDKSE